MMRWVMATVVGGIVGCLAGGATYALGLPLLVAIFCGTVIGLAVSSMIEKQ